MAERTEAPGMVGLGFIPRVGQGAGVPMCPVTLGQDWCEFFPTFFLFYPPCASHVLSYLLLSVLRTNCSSSLWHNIQEKLCELGKRDFCSLSSLSCLSHLASRLGGDARRTQEKLAKRALREPWALPPLHPARHSGQVPCGREVKSLICSLIREVHLCLATPVTTSQANG